LSVDVITVGGGLGGAALALTLAREGVRVLVLEMDREFRDRVRGECILPWGVNEARDLGVYDIIEAGCGRAVKQWISHGWKHRPPRDLTATTPRGAHCLNFYHPEMQEVLISAAEAAGARVLRGVRVKSITPGAMPSVTFDEDGKTETVSARLIVGADGKASLTKRLAGFENEVAPARMVIAGVLLGGVTATDDANHVFRNSSDGEGALIFPQGEGRARTYFMYRLRDKRRGLTGERNIPKFLEACRNVGVPSEWLKNAEAAGPLAEFMGANTWVPHPYKNGIALIGDAAASNDPSWGNGLSITLRDVRALRDCLLADDDWARAGDAYARTHDEYFSAICRVTDWLTDLLYEIGEEAETRRERAFAAMKADKSRNPDYIALGPNAPSDETARLRMFGEDL
jgi:2-polyprenyl-6-methoxyphenol hydroxylase-like FAD-dependent oxidoreductase